MLSFSYQWDEGKIKTIRLCDFPRYKKDKHNDYELAKLLWELFDTASVIVAHNGDAFDVRMVNVRLIKHGFTPPSPYKTIDTLKIARRYFRFFGNSLNDLAQFFGLGSKVQHSGFDLFQSCYEGDVKAWNKMKKYNRQDVFLLSEIYKRLRSWVKPVAQSNKNNTCPNLDCGSTQMQKRGTEARIGGIRIERLKCDSCGRWCYGNVIKKAV